MFSDAQHRIARFPALGTSCKFSRAWNNLHVASAWTNKAREIRVMNPLTNPDHSDFLKTNAPPDHKPDSDFSHRTQPGVAYKPLALKCYFGGEVRGERRVGYRPVLLFMTLFQTKLYHFPYPFSDLVCVSEAVNRAVSCRIKSFFTLLFFPLTFMHYRGIPVFRPMRLKKHTV